MSTVRYRLPQLAAALLFSTAALAEDCPKCEVWNRPHEPFQIYANTYYVGTATISSVLITSKDGHIMIDSAHNNSPPQILANIKKLGFNVSDVKLIVTSHVHDDHTGGIAALQNATGAMVKASPSSAAVLRTGVPSNDDPQRDIAPRFPAVANVQTVSDGETLKVGALAITAHFTPGHTPGGTAWTWDACDGPQCRHIAYLDSLNPVSSPAFKFTAAPQYPTVLQDFEKSFATVAALPCDIPISNHPEFSQLWERLEKRGKGNAEAMVDTAGCQRFVDNAKAWLTKRLAEERS